LTGDKSLVSEYRPCVVAVFTNKKAQILVCERSDVEGAWQLPQGGIEPGESALNAVYREMKEEIGCDSFKITKEASGLIKYKFPSDLKKPISKKWIGQSQIWFLCRFDEGANPDMSLADGEFVRYEWRDANKVIDGIVDWKRDSYIEGFIKLGLIDRKD
jgi:putative (di)nucleoside polyphosphate hydrolase